MHAVPKDYRTNTLFSKKLWTEEPNSSMFLFQNYQYLDFIFYLIDNTVDTDCLWFIVLAN